MQIEEKYSNYHWKLLLHITENITVNFIQTKLSFAK